KEGGIIRPGYNAELDELHTIARSGKEWIARFQAQEITRTGIPSLKVGFNQVFGYYIEITHTHVSKIPADYQRKQTLKNAERYITPDLKAYEEKVPTAATRSSIRCCRPARSCPTTWRWGRRPACSCSSPALTWLGKVFLSARWPCSPSWPRWAASSRPGRRGSAWPTAFSPASAPAM